MTPRRAILVALVLGALAATAFLAREAEGPGLRMTEVAGQFLGSLSGPQKAKAVFDFESGERTRWFFTPQQRDHKALRKGLPLEDMTAGQKRLAMELVRAGTGEEGYKRATTIMSLENILADLEKKGANVRNPEWYFFTLFGTPTRTGRWGLRVEGHHLSLNYTVDGGKLVSATPAFFGANPADVKGGPRKGLRPLPEAEDGARKLIASLDDDQRKVAHRAKGFPEIEEAVKKPGVGAPVGLTGAKMTDAQKATLLDLIRGYAGRLPDVISARELEAVQKGGIDRVYFAYGPGDGSPGVPYTYRVQNDDFVIEFVNEQADSAGNKANHIHSAWRTLKGDFGLAERP